MCLIQHCQFIHGSIDTAYSWLNSRIHVDASIPFRILSPRKFDTLKIGNSRSGDFVCARANVEIKRGLWKATEENVRTHWRG